MENEDEPRSSVEEVSLPPAPEQDSVSVTVQQGETTLSDSRPASGNAVEEREVVEVVCEGNT